MSDETTKRRVAAKAIRQRQRDELLAREIGGGIGDLCQGAVTKYAPTLVWSEAERRNLVATRRQEGQGFLPTYQLAAAPSQECLDALAVWRPLALRHLLSLDPQPRLKLVDARRAAAAAKERYEHFSEIVRTLASTRTALELPAKDEFVGALPATHSAIVDIVQKKTTGIWPTDRDLTREDRLSEKSETLDLVAHVLRYLQFDVTTLRNQANAQFNRARVARNEITGAKKWTAGQSLDVSRRLTTLVDALQQAYGRWTWPRVAELIRASATDWTTPPCPDLASKSVDDITSILKMRYRREKLRRQKFKLSPRILYPWLAHGNNTRHGS